MSEINEGGVVVGGQEIWTTAYADDIVLLSTRDALKEKYMRIGNEFIKAEANSKLNK